jgi:hypothetical protein
MLDISNAHLSMAVAHFCGNQTNEEELILSKSLLEIDEEKVRELLTKFFLNSFQQPEFNRFTFSNGDHQMNIIYQYATKIFDQPKNLLPQSVNMAKQLYDLSTHPQIKAGDFFVAYFHRINN